MYSPRVFFLPACLAIVGMTASCQEAATEPPPVADKGFAVVELFTSQGCSSCPPADKLLGKLIADAEAKKRPVFCLAFHVDYWDYLGWKDPNGSKSATQRQVAYREAFGARQVYTPQTIVNGTDEFVGSDEVRAKKSIDAALTRPAEATIALKPQAGTKKGTLDVRYEVTGAPKGAVLVVAFVETKISTKVLRGENARRTLDHFNVVRAFAMADLAKGNKGTTTLDLPAVGAGKVIAFVQVEKGAKIVGATAVAAP